MSRFQLYPQSRVLAPDEGIYDRLDLRRGRSRSSGNNLPYLAINMVGSVDGKARVSGGASGIGSLEDRAVMRSLRSKVDAVMIGGGTLRAERLSLGLDRGVGQPIGVVVSSHPAGLPLDNLVSLGEQEILVLTGPHGSEAADERALTVRIPGPDPGVVDLRAALEALARERGVETILVEGGPSLNAALISLGLVDELFLTVAPKILGGDVGPPTTIVEGRADRGPNLPSALRLVSASVADGELFLRYSF